MASGSRNPVPCVSAAGVLAAAVSAGLGIDPPPGLRLGRPAAVVRMVRGSVSGTLFVAADPFSVASGASFGAVGVVAGTSQPRSACVAGLVVSVAAGSSTATNGVNQPILLPLPGGMGGTGGTIG